MAGLSESAHVAGVSAAADTATSTAGNLTSFVGREKDIADLEELIERSPILTLAGPPGIGKSRLAAELARAVGGRHPVSTATVQLAPVEEEALVLQALASALDVKEAQGEDLRGRVRAELADRRLLLVLDNCEHLLDACAALAEWLVEECPALRVIATSREPLGVPAETVWAVPPLSVPLAASDLRLLDYAAMHLFVDRATAVEPGFALNEYVSPSVAEICRRLDGIPLAIELAAARVELLTPAEIATRLDDRFDLLVGGASAELPRHQTLEAALDWSYNLLSTPERLLLTRLSVFVGSFEVSHAEEVCCGGAVERAELPELLHGLERKSLIVSNPANGHYWLLETIRAYAREALERSADAPAIRETHARFFVALAERAEPELRRPNQDVWLSRLEDERPDLRSALDWSLGHGRSELALRLAGSLSWFWRMRCHFIEGRSALEAALSASDGSNPELEAKALWGTGLLTMMLGETERADTALKKSAARFGELGDVGGEARALLLLANNARRSNSATVLALAEKSAALAREAGDLWCLALALSVAGYEHLSGGNFPAARPLLEECVAVSREGGEKEGLRRGVLFLGQIALHQGHYGSAEPLLQEALRLAEELGDEYSTGTTFQYLGGLALHRGDYEHARHHLDNAIALLRKTRPADLQISLVARAWLARVEGEEPIARRLLEEALTLASHRGDDPTAALLGLAELAEAAATLPTARRHFEEALDLARAHGNVPHAARALTGIGRLARSQADPKRATLVYSEAIELSHRSGDVSGMVTSLEALAGLAAASNRPEHAARLFGAAAAARDAHGSGRPPNQSAAYEADVALARQSLPPEDFDAAWADGGRLSLDEAVAEAPKRRRRRGQAATGWGSLTEAELNVAALVARGTSNQGTADRLVISVGTVKNHLKSIFAKLGVTKRGEVAVEFWNRQDPPRA